MIKKRIKHSFKKKLFWYIMPLIVLISLFFMGIFIYQQDRLLRESLIKRGESLVKNLAIASELGVFSENNYFIEQAVKGAWVDEDVEYVFVYNKTGKVLSKYFKKNSEVNENLFDEVKDKIYSKRAYFWDYRSSPKGKVYEFYAPVVSKEEPIEDLLLGLELNVNEEKDEIIGALRIGVSISNIIEGKKKVIKSSIIITSSFLVLSFIGTYFVAKKITMPIFELTKSAQAIGKGKFDSEIVVNTSDEIALLANEFNAMRLKLKKLNRMKDDFVSLVSHELRTPLTSIKGYGSLFLSGKLGKLNEVQKEKMQRIVNQVTRLNDLITGILDISKIHHDNIDKERDWCSLSELVNTMVEELHIQLRDKNIEMVTEIPPDLPLLYVDEKLFARVFMNLIGNAIKFTQNGGKITINAQKEKDLIKVSCIDSGIGIPADSLDKVFDEFYRVGSMGAVKEKGSGLGLAIVKYIINAHQGRIWVESELGRGSKFIFTLPLMEREG